MLNKVLFVVAAVVSGLGVWAAPSGAQTPPGGVGTVVVVHGLVDFPADVYLDGASTPALSGFEYQRMTDPLALPAGTHRADLRRAGEPPTSPPALSGTFTVEADQRVTVAALLNPAGSPTWLAFPNDAQPADQSRVQLRFRHFAAAGPVNVLLDGQRLSAGVQNTSVSGQIAPALIAPGPHQLSVVDANSNAALLPPQVVDVSAGSIANVYLVGTASGGNLGLLLQDPSVASVSVSAKALDATPSAVPSGNSGLADPGFTEGRGDPMDTAWATGWVLAAGAWVIAMVAAARRRPLAVLRRTR